MSRWSGDSLLVPTHFYTVVTSCQEVNRSVEDCGGPLRVVSFLVPHRPDNREACNVSAAQRGAPRGSGETRLHVCSLFVSRAPRTSPSGWRSC